MELLSKSSFDVDLTRKLINHRTCLVSVEIHTSYGGCRREEKSHKHWSVFNMLIHSVTEFLLFFVRSNQLYLLIALKIREK